MQIYLIDILFRLFSFKSCFKKNQIIGLLFNIAQKDVENSINIFLYFIFNCWHSTDSEESEYICLFASPHVAI